jgi:hypothetical protein
VWMRRQHFESSRDQRRDSLMTRRPLDPAPVNRRPGEPSPIAY